MMIPGIAFIVLGVLVLVVPDLLKVMVAAAIHHGRRRAAVRRTAKVNRSAQKRVLDFEQQFTSGRRGRAAVIGRPPRGLMMRLRSAASGARVVRSTHAPVHDAHAQRAVDRLSTSGKSGRLREAVLGDRRR